MGLREAWTNAEGEACAVQAPTFADVNGDGHLEILVGSLSGAIFVLDRAGRDVENFPFYTQVAQPSLSSP